MEDAVKGLGADAPYWEALDRGELALPRCTSCGRWCWPAPFRCGSCGGWTFEWVSLPMTGVVYSWTRVWHPFGGAEDLDKPYVTASVALPQAGGIRLFGLLEPGDRAEIGLPVVGRVCKTRPFGQETAAIRWTAAS